jgi:hypothetical protein
MVKYVVIEERGQVLSNDKYIACAIGPFNDYDLANDYVNHMLKNWKGCTYTIVQLQKTNLLPMSK